MQNLSDIFNFYKSDKVKNNYAQFYENLFEKIRFQPLNLLEIGIGTLNPNAVSNMVFWGGPEYVQGASLKAFKKYFENAQIYGIDNQEDCMFSEDRITTFQLDSSNKEDCDKNLKNLEFDIIIDDGCHDPYYQTKTFKNLWNRVKKNGFYIIEDVDNGNRLYNDYLKEFSDYCSEIKAINNKEHCRFILFQPEN